MSRGADPDPEDDPLDDDNPFAGVDEEEDEDDLDDVDFDEDDGGDACDHGVPFDEDCEECDEEDRLDEASEYDGDSDDRESEDLKGWRRSSGCARSPRPDAPPIPAIRVTGDGSMPIPCPARTGGRGSPMPDWLDGLALACIALVGWMLVQSCGPTVPGRVVIASDGDTATQRLEARANGDRVPVTELFTRDGCTVYRFVDSSGAHYLASRPLATMWHNAADPCALGR